MRALIHSFEHGAWSPSETDYWYVEAGDRAYVEKVCQEPGQDPEVSIFEGKAILQLPSAVRDELRRLLTNLGSKAA